MKNLILLFLVVGAVVNAIDLTTAASPTATTALPLWTIAYNTAVASKYYSLTLTYYAGAAVTTPVAATGSAGTNSFGVICVFTASTFAPAVSSANSAFSFTVPSTTNAASAVGATTAATATWATPTMQSYPTITYAAAPTLTLTTVVDCPILNTAGTAVTAPTLSTFTATWVFTVANSCGNLPASGATWYAVCYPHLDTPAIITGTPTTSTLTGAKNITVTTTATTCTTTGASTFATGATILAGIAYLQF